MIRLLLFPYIATPVCSSTGRGTLATFNGSPFAWTQYRYNYTANASIHTIVFGFATENSGRRIWFLDNVSVVDVTAPATQLLQNPSFDNTTTAPVEWTQFCAHTCAGGSTYAGQVASGVNCTSTNCYMSRCNGASAFDTLSQSFPTIAGRNYTISFLIVDFGSGGSGNTKAYVDIY